MTFMTGLASPAPVLVADGSHLALTRPSPAIAVTARLRHASLDSRLAAGEPAERSILLAVRAAQLVSTSYRRRLAGHWDELAERARRPQRPGDLRVPVSRRRLHDADDALHEVAEALRSSRPVSARGVALAAALLTTAGSPVYAVGPGADLTTAVARAIAEL